LEQSKNAVLHSLAATSSQESYGHAIDEFIGWYCSEPRLAFNRTVVLRYRFFLEQKNLALSTIVRLAAVRRLAYEASDTGLLSPDLAAGIRRVKGAKRLGVRIGNWLTVPQSRTLLVNRLGKIWGDGITPKAIWHIVKAAAKRGGIRNLAPHDLRRTCARLCHLAGGELEQIQFLLGHASVQTTERYLGCKQKLSQAVNDNLGLEDT
jgi:integrase